MEDRDIPLEVTFGNYDEDYTEKTGMDKKDMMEYYMSYEDNITIKNSKGNKDIFNLYLFGSDSYANKDEEDLSGYAYITLCPSKYNTGLFMAMKDKKDVQGIYVGYNHINYFEKSYAGIKLGHAANSGYGTYVLSGENKDNMRGDRVFELNESNPTYYTSKMVYHKDI